MHIVWIFCIGIFTVAPELIKLFINSEYAEASLIVPPICLGIFFQMMYTFFYDIEYYHKKNKQIAVFSVITAIVNIILNYVAINIWGYQAAAYTTIVSYIILCLLHYFGMRKIDKTQYYDLKTLITLSIALILTTFANVIFNNSILIRYIILVISGIYILIRYKKLIVDFGSKAYEKVKVKGLKNE